MNPTTLTTRTCSICGETKPDAEYYRYPTGYVRPACRTCHIVRVRLSQRAHPEKTREANRRYRERHREALRERERSYRIKYRSRKAASQRAYYAAHREAVLARMKATRDLHRQMRIAAGLPVRMRGRPRTIECDS